MAFVIGLLSIPNSDFNLKTFGRALLPKGANIAPVTNLQARILAPLDSVQELPNEPLRFLAQVDGEGEGLDRIELQTRVFENRQSPIGMSARQNQKFSLDYNVGRNHSNLDSGRWCSDYYEMGSQLSQWFRMGVAPDRMYFLPSLFLSFVYPLNTHHHHRQTGDLKLGGTVVELFLETNRRRAWTHQA